MARLDLVKIVVCYRFYAILSAFLCQKLIACFVSAGVNQLNAWVCLLSNDNDAGGFDF